MSIMTIQNLVRSLAEEIGDLHARVRRLPTKKGTGGACLEPGAAWNVEQTNEWKEFYNVELVEEDEEAIFDVYSKVVLENRSFNDAFTNRHWP
ncbi:unnamed protein product [Lupinus luteus]|uniref:Uncharacterized protein n=1 Tax=Lupinus luteus TaxID=3873 RepID=A0AAV1W0Y6_LUPLU